MTEAPSDAGAVHDKWTWVSPAVAVSPVGALTFWAVVPGEVRGVTDGVVVPDVGVLGGGEVGMIRSSVAGASTDRGPWPAAFTAITLK
jgi:hypothetical protein